MLPASSRGWGAAGTSALKAKQVRVRVEGITLWVHRDVATLVALLVKDLVRAGYKVSGGTPDDWGFASRRKRPPATGWSNHAWGLAIDLNALRNPMRRRGLPRRTQFAPATVRQIAARYGFRWGGDWRTPDPMHLEADMTPAQARILTLRWTGAAASRTRPPAPRPPVAGKPAPLPPWTTLRVRKPLMRGTNVVHVQRALLRLKYPVAVDGVYGPGTARAVAAFQRSRQLTADGVLGPKTIYALRRAIGARTS